MTCEVCNDKRYIKVVRDDGREAIERCDFCSFFGDNDPRTLRDEDAAFLARSDGIQCATEYPCVLTNSRSELHEIAEYMGEFARAVTFDEALILAKGMFPEESHTITTNLAEIIRNKSLM
jgi:CRISPR/Cas system-associated protein Cas10 (large subunit of type III CRISPR-Cas system)